MENCTLITRRLKSNEVRRNSQLFLVTGVGGYIKSFCLQHHNVCDWDAPPEDTEMPHTGSSPHFNGQHSAAKDWSVLAGGGTIPSSQPVKPKWAIPEPENEYVK